MTKEHAYAYEAGYRDGSTNYELEHCPACKNVADLQDALAENAKLRDENARLRSCLSDDADNARQIMGENAKLRERIHELEIEYDGATTAVLEKTERIEWIAGRLRGETNENAKLRELVDELYPLADYGAMDASELDRAHDLMRELGVDDG